MICGATGALRSTPTRPWGCWGSATSCGGGRGRGAWFWPPPAKFAETVEPLIGEVLPVPQGITRVMDLPRRSVEIEPEMRALRGMLADISQKK